MNGRVSHELERSLIFEESDSLDLVMLAGTPDSGVMTDMDADQWFNAAFQFPEKGFNIEEAVVEIIEHALRQTQQNVSAAARLLGVNRDYIRYRLSEKKS
jgi:two-component system, NtrC family, response regulator AtoC